MSESNTNKDSFTARLCGTVHFRPVHVVITSDYVKAKIAELKARFAHAGDFCFFTDIKNLRPILAEKALYSRNMALAKGLVKCDCASASVLNGTPPWVRDYARIYFAPKTPMLYRVEGIKHQQDEWPECPIPVYFVFRPEVVTLPGAMISNGNMGARDTVCRPASEEFFDALPFDDIFHRSSTWMNPRKKEIVACRHAEILIPQSVSLDQIAKLVFRSSAEKVLAERLADLPSGIDIEVDRNWFNAARAFLEKVDGRNLFVQNAQHNDRFVTLTANSDGKVEAKEYIYGITSWSGAKEVESDGICLEMPQPGETYAFLNGHRIAILN